MILVLSILVNRSLLYDVHTSFIHIYNMYTHIYTHSYTYTPAHNSLHAYIKIPYHILITTFTHIPQAHTQTPFHKTIINYSLSEAVFY